MEKQTSMNSNTRTIFYIIVGVLSIAALMSFYKFMFVKTMFGNNATGLVWFIILTGINVGLVRWIQKGKEKEIIQSNSEKILQS